ncbi:MAG: DUF72 domain-containing protein [Candidatus Eisenbacteria bacterium]
MILVGTSGFSFDDWVGVFYPPYLKKSEHFAWYLRHFPALEVNSTYYRIPARSLFERWARLAPDRYPFIVKLHGDVTHKRRNTRDSIANLVRAVEPLRAAGKLAGWLAQFPWSFREGQEERRYLSEVRSLLPSDDPLFAEFRRDEWDNGETYRFLEEEKIGFCAVDEPRLTGLMPPVAKATNGIGYVRLHGRNAKAWWGPEGSGDRYDWLYSDQELREWVGRIRDLDRETSRAFVFFNNCYAGQAVRGAKRMQELLGIPLTGEEAQTLDL